MDNIDDFLTPKCIDDLVISKSTKDSIKHGIFDNFLFYGTEGTAKTTTAKMLTKDYHTLYVKQKLGVDVIRNKIYDFCTEHSLLLKDYKYNTKIVYFEEFDHATPTMQSELRSFMDDFKNVKFIATCNYIHKIDAPIQSRFTLFDFNIKSKNEFEELKNNLYSYLNEKNKKLQIDDTILHKIIDNNFPDIRKITKQIKKTIISDSKLVEDDISSNIGSLFTMVFEEKDSEIIWHYLNTNWKDRIDDAFNLFSKYLWSWVVDNRPTEKHKLPNCIILISKYIDERLINARNPFITLCSMIFEIQKL